MTGKGMADGHLKLRPVSRKLAIASELPTVKRVAQERTRLSRQKIRFLTFGWKRLKYEIDKWEISGRSAKLSVAGSRPNDWSTE